MTVLPPTLSVADGFDIGEAASGIGQTGLVVTLLSIIVVLIRIQITRTEQREAAARDDCDGRIHAAVEPLDAEIARLRRLLGIVAIAIHETHPDLSRYLRLDGIDPAPTPARGVPVTPPSSPAPPVDGA